MDERETIQEIRERLVKIELLLENIPKSINLQLENLEDKLKVANHRIEDLEKNNTWLWRTIVGAVLSGAIALLFELSKFIK
jgi:cupin superfamily acireductone dioxygenase involved in methionine salvage